LAARLRSGLQGEPVRDARPQAARLRGTARADARGLRGRRHQAWARALPTTADPSSRRAAAPGLPRVAPVAVPGGARVPSLVVVHRRGPADARCERGGAGPRRPSRGSRFDPDAGAMGLSTVPPGPLGWTRLSAP